MNVFFFLFAPGQAWDRVVRNGRGLFSIMFLQVLPLILAGAFLEGWGLVHWGKWQPKFEVVRLFPADQMVPYEICQSLVLLLTILLSALLVLQVSQTFHERNRFVEAFRLTAYAFGPILWMHFLDAFPGMSPWATWLLGILLSTWILYQGIPRVLQPDPTHAFGLYLSTVFIFLLATGLERAITGMYLLGYLDFSHSWLTREWSRFFTH